MGFITIKPPFSHLFQASNKQIREPLRWETQQSNPPSHCFHTAVSCAFHHWYLCRYTTVQWGEPGDFLVRLRRVEIDTLRILSPKLRMVIEPKYFAFRRWLYTPIIFWQGDWIPRDGEAEHSKRFGGQTGFRDPFECGGSVRETDFKSGGLNLGPWLHIVEKRVNSRYFCFVNC